MNQFKERIAHFVSVIEQAALRRESHVKAVRFFPCDYLRPPVPPGEDAPWRPYDNAKGWGGVKDGHAWFSFAVDAEEGADVPYLSVSTHRQGWDATNPQFLVWIDGKMTQGADVNHTRIFLPFGHHTVLAYAYTGYACADVLQFSADVAYVRPGVEAYYYDLAVPFESMEYADKESGAYSHTLHALNESLNLLDLRDPSSPAFEESCIAASGCLQAGLYGKQTNPDVLVTCVGHTHIDIAWLWPVRQTREKACRSFATVLEYMRRYPEYKFFSSQPFLYRSLKEDAPELFEELKARVAEGRWEPEGSMWVEADCNLPSGESLVRQILYGKRFFREEFGLENRMLWLPDVFGYSAALPQILKKSGIDTFVTSKISWNDTNRLPFDTFLWKGIDGTDVLTYFITTQDMTDKPSANLTTYNGTTAPKQVAGAYKRYRQKDVSGEVMLLYGYGDGGGGPTQKHIEYLRRLGGGLPLCPRAVSGTAGDFVRRLHTNAAKAKRLPVWSGELYLEFHRGTYTSIAKNKRNNRKAEFLMQRVEGLCAAAALRGRPYPQKSLDKAWHMLLTNQFHDIIPGSSVKEVYEVTDREYAAFFTAQNAEAEDALACLTRGIKAGSLVVYNPHSFTASAPVELDGQSVYAQSIPPKGYRVINRPAVRGRVSVSQTGIENDYFSITLDSRADITGIYDKRAGRDVLKKDTACGLVVYEDRPAEYDAWEIGSYYGERSWHMDAVTSVAPVFYGEKAGLRVIRTFDKSTLTQNILLHDDLPQIDFECTADWQTEHVLLKAEFPLALNAASAVYDIQFGAVERPATRNTSWEQARFEVCAHKYAVMQEYAYGVAVMNDCKYGYSANGSDLALTLLKCSTDPNQGVDKGAHTFTYSVMPYAGDYRTAGVIQAAYLLNAPLAAVVVQPCAGVNESASDAFSFVSVDVPDVIVETIKAAEDGDGIILRAYEAYNQTAKATLSFGFPLKSACLCDLLENDLSPVPCANNAVALTFKPYEIHTLRVFADSQKSAAPPRKPARRPTKE